MEAREDGFVALVVGSESQRESELAALSRVVPALQQSGLRVFSPDSGLAMFPPDRWTVGSLYFTEDARFDQVVVGRNVRIFRSQWGRAFLGFLAALLTPAGHVVLPVMADAQADAGGMWRVRDLERLLGSRAEQLGEGMWSFQSPCHEIVAYSTLRWFLRNASQVVHAELVARYVPDAVDALRSDRILGEFLLGAPAPDDLEPPDRNGSSATRWFERHDAQVTPVGYGEVYGRTLRWISYLVSGISYKASIISHIVRTLSRAPTPLSTIDFGGAYGLLTAELLLDPSLDFATGVCCEHSSPYLFATTRLYRAMRRELQGRFYFASSRGEDFSWDGSYSLVTFLSSLLYMERRNEVIARAWEHTEPGGLLVVYEVPKSDPRNKDYDIQFTAAELDDLLGRLGQVHRYSPLAARTVSVDEAGETPVFRAVVKPESTS